ncbi:hypothetical protein DYB32_003269 [Aphanomyces invadans]|uniref:BED-type domain-containing protein n=1 Tax=Aphanomyces invadans TaxID=157072 RepID=A0A418B6S0_9STRA|nr:hypothetical protein DYB32_003269 [Aphanomyces invadans]
MSQHSFSPSQFAEPVDPFIEDILELQPQDALDMVIVDDVDDDAMAVPASEQKRGRFTSDIWYLFTDDVEPQKVKSATCKHCETAFNHQCMQNTTLGFIVIY